MNQNEKKYNSKCKEKKNKNKMKTQRKPIGYHYNITLYTFSTIPLYTLYIQYHYIHYIPLHIYIFLTYNLLYLHWY